MLKLTGKLLASKQKINDKTGEVTGIISILAKVLKYGDVSYEVIDIRCSPSEVVNLEKDIGKDIDVCIYATISYPKSCKLVDGK
jgi:hypothetical protein